MGHEAGTSPHWLQDTGAASVGGSAFPSGEVPSEPPLTTGHTDMGGSWTWGAHRDPTVVSLQPLLSPGTALMRCTCSRVHRSDAHLHTAQPGAALHGRVPAAPWPAEALGLPDPALVSGVRVLPSEPHVPSGFCFVVVTSTSPIQEITSHSARLY